MLRGFVVTILLLVAGVVASEPLPGSDAVSVPRCINYQGKLTGTGGEVLNDTFTMTFRLFSGGSQMWAESQVVPVANSVFNVILGAVVPIVTVPEAGNCSLAVLVRGEQVGGRIPLVSAPYSYNAMKSDNADKLGGVAAGNYISNVTGAAGDLGGTYPAPTVTGLRGRVVANAAPTIGQVMTWDGSAWTPAAPASSANYWSDGGTYINPNMPSGGNAGIRAYQTASANYNLYSQTNAAGQSAVYGAALTADPSHGVIGYSQQYDVQGVLGYGHYSATAPKAYPCGVYGSGGTQRDAIVGQANNSTCFGAWGQNAASTGTGVGGSGNGQSGATLVDGSGGAFTGYKYALFSRCFDTNPTDQTAAGYFQADASTNNNRCWVACWSTSGNGYRIIGNGACASGFDTRDGERVMVAVESPEARVEDIGRGKLVEGRARIDLDPLFSDCVTVTDALPLDVFVQLQDDCNGVYVRTDSRGFDVRELAGGKSSAAFSYRVVAHRRGGGHERFVRSVEAPAMTDGAGR